MSFTKSSKKWECAWRWSNILLQCSPECKQDFSNSATSSLNVYIFNHEQYVVFISLLCPETFLLYVLHSYLSPATCCLLDWCLLLKSDDKMCHLWIVLNHNAVMDVVAFALFWMTFSSPWRSIQWHIQPIRSQPLRVNWRYLVDPPAWGASEKWLVALILLMKTNDGLTRLSWSTESVQAVVLKMGSVGTPVGEKTSQQSSTLCR